MGDSAISWKTKKQSPVTLSSVEAEHMVMCQAAKVAVWLMGFLEDLGIHLHSTPVISGVNQGALALTHNPVFHLCSKYCLFGDVAGCRGGLPQHRHDVSPANTVCPIL